jgi:hypothetical protein
MMRLSFWGQGKEQGKTIFSPLERERIQARRPGTLKMVVLAPGERILALPGVTSGSWAFSMARESLG